jgi:DNA-binding XRE family transcriptional regulator
MPSTLRLAVGAWCRRTRIELDITQQQLADALGISRTYLVAIEAGRANPSLALVDRMGDALDTTFELIANGPKLIGGTRERDLIHARCSGYVGRRLKAAGLDVAREVGIIDGRSRGWIDLLAFDRRTGTMLIVEIRPSSTTWAGSSASSVGMSASRGGRTKPGRGGPAGSRAGSWCLPRHRPTPRSRGSVTP